MNLRALSRDMQREGKHDKETCICDFLHNISAYLILYICYASK